MDDTALSHITDISETLLIPLYARAAESQTLHPILIDTKAVEITNELNKFFKTSSSPLYQSLLKGKIRRKLGKKLNVIFALRTRKFDDYCTSFLQKHPNGIIIELGCGLSTRFTRIDNGAVAWYDLDLPEVIDIRKQFFTETNRDHFIASSVLNFTWMNRIPQDNKNILILAEGLFMYLHEDDVKNLIRQLQQTFPGCDLAAEVVNTYIVWILQKKIWRKKFQRDYHLGPDASFYFGIHDSRDLEQWNQGLHFLDDWTYFDEKEKKLGWMNIFARSKKLRKTQWIIHYQLK